ncbi:MULTISPECIES: substrate-binding periplasmic protein [unclassified Haematobacter]|uniref:substrate-binding periplasmic protein n=1 Tax=unclassified Haematobacter TaxID=2640585 RepID=UPI0025B975A2|nr:MULTISPECIES: transporter substrate-binding domain-containing protein [unclassified Haematobacter]
MNAPPASPLRGRWGPAIRNLGIVVVILALAGLLPQDNSLAERRAAGVLKLCVPPAYPPLVTGEPDRPGYDVELARILADRVGLRLAVNVVPTIGRDFNPRNWNLTRAQCDMIGGGIADTPTARGFLQLLPTGERIGWLLLLPAGALPPSGSTLAVLPGASGLDRLALSAWMRAEGYRPLLVADGAALRTALLEGRAAAAVGENFALSGQEGALPGFTAVWPDDPALAPVPLAFETWKGDVTLKRALTAALSDAAGREEIATLRNRYGLTAEAGAASHM